MTKVQTLRQRLEQHRANAMCASCHKLMDPLGFALESFDAVGKLPDLRRELRADRQLRRLRRRHAASTALPGLRQVLVDHSDQFLVNVTQTLMTYALGRGVEYYDMPAVRAILRAAAPQNYRFSSIVLGIVKSTPFQMRRSDS